MSDPIWIFGYGSLIFKQDFPSIARRPAAINGWERRFWQGSHDHRGIPEAPGRVVTLIRSAGALCQGMAYLVAPEVLAHLDYREKNGYQRVQEQLHLEGGEPVTGLVYLATEDNEAYLGPAQPAVMAQHIHKSVGPSGSNRDYLLQLAQALRELSAHDEHVFMLAELVGAMSECDETTG